MAQAVDAAGNIVIVGTTTSSSLPVSAQSFQAAHAPGFPGNKDIFIAKFGAIGRQLLWSTFLGGDSDDTPSAIALDPSGNILLSGTTNSSNFPTNYSLTCASQTVPTFSRSCKVNSFAAQPGNVQYQFLAKITQDGKQLQFSVGFSFSQLGAIAADFLGSSFLSAIDSTGLSIFHFTASGNTLSYAVSLGAPHDTVANSMLVDPSGDCYIVGSTDDNSIPTTNNAMQPQYSNTGLSSSTGLHNGYIVELDSVGSRILYGTYFGQKYFDTTFTTAALSLNSVYISGGTNSNTLPATIGAYVTTAPNSYPGGTFGFVTKITPGSTTVDTLSYLGTAGKKLAVSNWLEILTSDGLIQLSTPSLSLLAAQPLKGYTDLALISSSVWVAGNCSAGACPSGLPSGDAYQAQGASTQSIFILQEMDVNTAVISVVNAASLQPSPLAPGQLATLFGTILGPTAGVSGQVTGGFFGGSIGGTQVTFNGISAPIFFAQANQLNVSVPCALRGLSSAQVVVSYNGASSSPISVPLTISAPAIFTVNGSGLGQGAVFNQDLSLNSPSNPAARGSAIMLFATGLPSPICSDGQILPAANDIAAVGGINNEGAPLLYAGQAPGSVSGLQQVNLTVPTDSLTGPAILLVLSADGAFSPAGVTIAVK